MKKDESTLKKVVTGERMKTGNDYVKLLVTTEDYLITGKLLLPIPAVVENPTTENL